MLHSCALQKYALTCLTAILNRGGTLKSISTAANRSSLPLLAEALVFAPASHLTAWFGRLASCWNLQGPELKAYRQAPSSAYQVSLAIVTP